MCGSLSLAACIMSAIGSLSPLNSASLYFYHQKIEELSLHSDFFQGKISAGKPYVVCIYILLFIFGLNISLHRVAKYFFALEGTIIGYMIFFLNHLFLCLSFSISLASSFKFIRCSFFFSNSTLI